MVRDPLLLRVRGRERQERLQLQRVDQRRILGDLVVEALGAVRAICDGDVASMAWRWRSSIEDAVDAQPSFGGTMTVRVSPTFMSSTASSKPGICAPTPSVNCCGRAGKVCLVPSTCVIRNRTDGVASERDMVRRGDERRAAACRRRPRARRNRAAPAGLVSVCRRSPRPRRGTAGLTSWSPRVLLRLRAGRALVLQRLRHSRHRGRNAACCWLSAR